jgi:hypothetical protein
VRIYNIKIITDVVLCRFNLSEILCGVKFKAACYNKRISTTSPGTNDLYTIFQMKSEIYIVKNPTFYLEI